MKKEIVALTEAITAKLYKNSVVFFYCSTKVTISNIKLKKTLGRLDNASVLGKINWEKIKVGTPFTAYIHGEMATGKIQKEDGIIFLCQDEQKGMCCNNTLGYKYSWQIGRGTAKDLNDDCINTIMVSFAESSKKELLLRCIEEDVICDYKITFLPGRVIIGCQEIENEKLEELIKMLPE